MENLLERDTTFFDAILSRPLIPIQGSMIDAVSVVAVFIAFVFVVILFIRTKRYGFVRLFFLAISSVVFVSLFHLCFCAIRNLIFGISYISKNDLLAFSWLFIATFFFSFTITFGRLFCGWICPLGFMLEVVGKIGSFIRHKKTLIMGLIYTVIIFFFAVLYLDKPQTQFISEIAPGIMVIYLIIVLNVYIYFPSLREKLYGARYIALIIFVIFNVLGIFTYEVWCFFQGGEIYYMDICSFIVVIFSSLLLNRFWCRYVCPLGALLGLMNKQSVIQITDPPMNNKLKDECASVCPVGALRSGKRIVTRCIYCGNCIEQCESQKKYSV